MFIISVEVAVILQEVVEAVEAIHDHEEGMRLMFYTKTKKFTINTTTKMTYFS